MRAVLALSAAVHDPGHDRLSVLHFLAPAAVGGLESVVRMLAAGQRQRGHDVLVAPLVTSEDSRATWIDSLRAAGVAVHPLTAAHRRYVAEWRAAAALVAGRRPSIVHTHGYHGDIVAGLAARRSGSPTVATVHGFIGGDWKNRLYEWLQARVLRDFDAVIAVSRPMAERLRRSGVPSDRLHVVVNAFAAGEAAVLSRAEARRHLGLGADGFHIGWIGRLSQEKGADVMVRALAALGDREARLSILGEGRERARIETLARRLGVALRITWHGALPHAARLLSAFDVVVLSSRTEGTPIVLFEAMAAGVPVVATRVGGIPDVVSGSEVLLVDPEDPPAIARAIEAIRDDAAAAAARASAARRRLTREFAPEPWVARVDAVYRAAISSRGAAPAR